jgi:exopolysaccharide production protein ExoF
MTVNKKSDSLRSGLFIQRRLRDALLVSFGIISLTAVVAVTAFPPVLSDATVERKREREKAQAQAVIHPVLPHDRTASLVSSRSRFSLSDSLKIVFFERLGGGDDGNGTANTYSRLVERTELTGVYVVNESGEVLIPLLGSVEVEGVFADRAVANLEAAYKQTFGRDCKASVAVVRHEPIYVVFDQLRSGTYSFTPGMTVLHAIALSGGGDGKRPELYLQMEYAREQERLAESTQKLKRVLASSAVLQAEISGQPVRIPKRLTELVGEQESKALTTEADELREVERNSRQAQLVALQAAVAVARGAYGQYEGKQAIIERQIASKKKRRGIVDTLRKKGMASTFLYYQTDADVANIEERQYEVVSGMKDARLKLEQAERNLDKLKAEHRLALERQAEAATAEIQLLETQIAGSRRLISDYQLSAIRSDSEGDNFSFEIVRRTRAGLKRIIATETTELIPGDLVRVSTTTASLARTGETASDRTSTVAPKSDSAVHSARPSTEMGSNRKQTDASDHRSPQQRNRHVSQPGDEPPVS